jgi:hypothetical protein
VAFDVGLNLGASGVPDATAPGTFTLYLANRPNATTAMGIVQGSFSTVAQIPAPPTVLLLAIGIAGAAARQWRRR